MPRLAHDGADLFYQTRGSGGPAILFIQGIGVGARGWTPQTTPLAERHRTLAYDHRGIGQTPLPPGCSLSIEQMAADARALADAAGWDSFHVVGHSMGGVVAQRLALTSPEQVKSLTLLCTVARGSDAVPFTARTLAMALRTRIGPRARRRRAFLEMLYPAAHLAAIDRDALVAELSDLFERDLADQPPILMKQAMALRAHDCRSELAALGGVPTMVVSAAHDPIAPPRFGRELAALIPGATYTEIADASHALPVHKAADINRRIEQFIAANT